MKKYLTLIVFLLNVQCLLAQSTPADSLLNKLDDENKTNQPVAIFKSSRMVLMQSSETVKKKNLNFLVIHRFGDLGGQFGGGQTYFGLDAVSDVYLGLEYGLTDNFNIDIGRSTIGGLADAEIKYALLHQTQNGSSPLAITFVGEAGVRPYRTFNSFSDRLSYFGELIFARKFSPFLALQIAPAYVRNNSPIPLVEGNPQSFMAISGTARFRISNHAGFIVDYARNLSAFRNDDASGFSDPLGFGLEMETGGHVFTVNVTNARAINEINYLSNGTLSSYSKGQYRIGFTISRMFDFNARKKTSKTDSTTN